MLIQTVPSWLSKLSDRLTYSVQTYPVLIRSIPSNFKTSCNSPDVAEFPNGNKDMITHLSSLQHIEFFTCTHDPLQHRSQFFFILFILLSIGADPMLDFTVSHTSLLPLPQRPVP